MLTRVSLLTICAIVFACMFANVPVPHAAAQTVCINCNLATPTPSPSPTPSPGPTAGVTPSPIPTATAAANTYYVSPTGSDSNAGTGPNVPFLTVQKALQVATAGKTVVVKGGTYSATASSNTSQCAGGCLAFQLNTGSNGSPITVQCQTMYACTFDGGSPTTGAGYAIIANGNTAASYLVFRGFHCQNFKSGCIQLNGGSGGVSKANTNLVYEYNDCNNVGLTCVLGGAYSTNNTFQYNSFSYVGSWNGFSVCPGSNANDHDLYLQAAGQVIKNNTFSKTNCGWYLQLADDTPGSIASATMIGNSFGPRNPVAPSTTGLFVLYQGTQGHTPSIDFENNAAYGSVGAYAHCFSQTAAGNPTITISTNVFGDNNSLIDCGGTYTLISAGNVRNVNIGFLVGLPINQADFEVHNTSPLCNAGLPYTGWITDIVGVNRPQVFVNPDAGAFSCNGY